MDPVKTGRLIAHARRRGGLTQAELAQMLHVTNKAVSKWECGRGFPDSAVLEALAEHLGLSPAELLRGRAGEAAPPGGGAAEAGSAECRGGAEKAGRWSALGGCLRESAGRLRLLLLSAAALLLHLAAWSFCMRHFRNDYPYWAALLNVGYGLALARPGRERPGGAGGGGRLHALAALAAAGCLAAFLLALTFAKGEHSGTICRVLLKAAVAALLCLVFALALARREPDAPALTALPYLWCLIALLLNFLLFQQNSNSTVPCDRLRLAARSLVLYAGAVVPRLLPDKPKR